MQQSSRRLPNLSGQFTLIEIIVAITLIGALTAVALLNFIDVGPQARVASLESLQRNLQAGTSFANAQCRLAQGCQNSGWSSAAIVNPDGTEGRMYNGYPTSNATVFASHITKWVEVSGFSIDTSNPLYTDFLSKSASKPDECKVRYIYAQEFGDAPSIALTKIGC